MKLIVIPPYKNPAANMAYVISKLVGKFTRKNPFDGDEIAVDEGYPLAEYTEARDAAFLASITSGFLKKVREYSEMGAFDAIVSTGFLDPGFDAARTISRIPVAGALHSSLLVASLIGKRTSIVIGAIPLALAVRVDSLILGCEPTEFWEDEVRKQLDAAGYDEIPLISPTSACVQMAKAMVNMQLKQTPRAYPTDSLRVQPEYA